MPGIYEANTTSEEAQSDTPVQNPPIDEFTIESSPPEDDQPPHESDQTDKINKFLLKSFLQHINSHPVNMPTEPIERNSDESDGDWNWNNANYLQLLVHFEVLCSYTASTILFKSTACPQPNQK